MAKVLLVLGDLELNTPCPTPLKSLSLYLLFFLKVYLCFLTSSLYTFCYHHRRRRCRIYVLLCSCLTLVLTLPKSFTRQKPVYDYYNEHSATCMVPYIFYPRFLLRKIIVTNILLA